MARRAIHPGTKFRDVFTSRFVNELTKETPPGNVVPSTRYSQSDVRVMGQMEDVSGTVIEPYDPVLIMAPAVLYNRNDALLPNEAPQIPSVIVQHLSLYSRTVHGWIPHWGIALGQITASQAAPVLLTGISYLKMSGFIPTSNTQYIHGVDIVDGTMLYSSFGRAEIIGEVDSSSTHCMVNLSRRVKHTLMGRTLSTIPGGGTGSFSVKIPNDTNWTITGLTYTCFNPSSASVGTNRNIIVTEIDGRWVIIWADCAS